METIKYEKFATAFNCTLEDVQKAHEEIVRERPSFDGAPDGEVRMGAWTYLEEKLASRGFIQQYGWYTDDVGGLFQTRNTRELRISKTINLDCATLEKVHEKYPGKWSVFAETAILDYLAVGDVSRVLGEREKYPSTRLRGNKTITMAAETFKKIAEAADGRRVVNAIIEVALWKALDKEEVK